MNIFRKRARSAEDAAVLTRLKGRTADWKRRADASAERVTAIKAQTRQLEDEVRRLQAEVTRLREQRRTQRDAQNALVEELTAQRTRAEGLQRMVLQHKTVRESLPGRAVAARVRATLPDARAREAAFLAVSSAYRDVSTRTPDPALRSTRIQGCPWWYPLISERQASPGARWEEKQKFPYRGIVQTRELAMGGVMLDLGANTGRMSISRALLGDVIAAYCAEPDPSNYEALARNVLSNGLGGIVMPDHLAIGDRDGVARLRRSQFAGGHRLVAGEAPDLIDVPVRTLDGWVGTLGIDLRLVTFVKMDVQGWERQVFDGAARVLAQRHIAWQIELAPEVLRTAGTDPRDLVARITASFTRFTDLSKTASGPRSRPVAELAASVEYVLDGTVDQTDLLLFSTDVAGA